MEKRTTLRIPIKLYNQVISTLDKSEIKVSLNTFILKCVEKQIRKKGMI